jgi:hypothetical protein
MTQAYATPAPVHPAKLYHYQDYVPEHLRSILTEHKVHCSDPSNVNDPWDFQPWFDYRPMLNDPDAIEAMFEFFRSAAPPSVLNEPMRIILEENIRRNPDELRRFVEKFSRNLGSILSTRKIYCLSPHPDLTLMWSHYAKKHTGICLEFDGNSELFRAAKPVIYCSTYPEWLVHKSRTEYLTELILTKSADWGYEHEYRIIASPNYDDGIPIKPEGDFLRISPDALTAVIIGCKAPADEITTLINNYAPNVTIKRAQRVPNHYRLQMV